MRNLPFCPTDDRSGLEEIARVALRAVRLCVFVGFLICVEVSGLIILRKKDLQVIMS